MNNSTLAWQEVPIRGCVAYLHQFEDELFAVTVEGLVYRLVPAREPARETAQGKDAE